MNKTFRFTFDMSVLDKTLACLEFEISPVNKLSKIRHGVKGALTWIPKTLTVQIYACI